MTRKLSPRGLQITLLIAFAFTVRLWLAPELDADNQPVLDSSGQPQLVNINSIESYRRTLLFQRLGFSRYSDQNSWRGASQFSTNAVTHRLP